MNRQFVLPSAFVVVCLCAALAPAGLVGHWKLDEARGTKANDATGHGFTGTLIGGFAFDANKLSGRPAASVPGKFARALDFNGVQDYISIRPLNLNSNTITFVAWVKRNGSQVPLAGLISNHSDTHHNSISFGDRNELYIHWGEMYAHWHTGLIVPDNKWVFTALTVAPNQMIAYMAVDGVLEDSISPEPGPFSVEAFDTNTSIGRMGSIPDRFYKGAVDEIRIYNHTLTRGEIEYLATGLLARYKFDETSGTIANDSTGHGFTTTLQGGLSFDACSVPGPFQFGNALYFDGIDDYGKIPALNLNSHDITLSAWVKRDGPQMPWAGIVFHQVTDYAGYGNYYDGYSFGFADELRFHWNGTTGWQWDSGLVVPDNKWTFTAMVVSWTELYLHMALDGVLSSSKYPVGGVFVAEPFARWTAIGRMGEHTARIYKGIIDDVRIYDRTLTLAELQNIVKSPLACNPSPLDLAEDVWHQLTLSWSPGQYAAKQNAHDVYFGTDFDQVADATTADPQYKGRQTGTTCDPGQLQMNHTYYWRIDEVNTGHPGSPWKGTVWRFSTAACMVLDNFESYSSTTLHNVWQDGINSGTCSEIYISTTIFCGGTRSMKYLYDNTGEYCSAYYSEIIRQYPAPQDWTLYGLAALSLDFRGTGTNVPDPMYLGIEDNAGNLAIIYYAGDINDLKSVECKQWNIKLQDFVDVNNVDLTAVTKIYIGFGDRTNTTPGNTGAVYFDNLRLCVPRCIPGFGPEADFTGDCTVDWADLKMLARDWLRTDANSPTLAWFKFDETSGTIAHDQSGNFQGTVSTNSAWDPNGGFDYNSCLYFDGTTGVMMPPESLDGITDQITISLWIYGENQPQLDFVLLAGDTIDYAMFIHCPRNLGDVWWRCDTTDKNPDNKIDQVVWWTATSNDWENQWNHYAFTKDISSPDRHEMKIFCNGMQRAVYDATYHKMGGWKKFAVGRRFEDENNKYHGWLDDLRIYDRALTDAEIRSIMDGTDGIVPGKYRPILSPANLRDPEPPLSRAVNFCDFQVLKQNWLETQFWP